MYICMLHCCHYVDAETDTLFRAGVVVQYECGYCGFISISQW